MLVQVLSMTPDQIAGLDSQQQASVMQLVSWRAGRERGMWLTMQRQQFLS